MFSKTSELQDALTLAFPSGTEIHLVPHIFSRNFLYMMASASQFLQLTAQCLCKMHTFKAFVPQTSLPLTGACCHCNSCRASTGGMYTLDVAWYGSKESIKNSSLRMYAFSSRLNIFFCGNCSTPMFNDALETKATLDHPHGCLSVFVGALAHLPQMDLIKITGHIFVEDTIDGGASVFMQHPNSGRDERVPRWAGWAEDLKSVDPSWPSARQLQTATESSALDRIPIKCHCGGVDLSLQRPTRAFADVSPTELPRFVDPQAKKLIATFDACDTCRLMSGTHLWHWTFALLAHIEFGSGSPAKFPNSTLDLKAVVGSEKRDPRYGTLSFYRSSPDVQRYFCSSCAATVFYAVDDLPNQVDIAVGLLRAPEGARAESLLVWDFGNVGFDEDVAESWRKGMIKAINDEAEDWRVQRKLPKTWRRVARERRLRSS